MKDTEAAMKGLQSMNSMNMMALPLSARITSPKGYQAHQERTSSIVTVDIDLEEIDDRLELLDESVVEMQHNLKKPSIFKLVSFLPYFIYLQKFT
jgi:hypothetical protein